MKLQISFFVLLFTIVSSASQTLPPKEPFPHDIKQIHSGHSLTDPLFHPNWPGQYLNLVGLLLNRSGGAIRDDLVGKSTIPGSSMKYRWENAPGFGAPDARADISEWELLCITEGVPLLIEGTNDQDWYKEGIVQQREYLSRFLNNAWENGNSGNGAPTLLWTTWTNIDDSDGPWRQMLDIQGVEWETMQDYANENRPNGAPPVYLIPGHKLMAKIYDDIELGLVPGLNDISDLFSDNIHTNAIGAYAIALIHYACIFHINPVGLTSDLIMDGNSNNLLSDELALYLQETVWDVVQSYERTGVGVASKKNLLAEENLVIYPNPAGEEITISNSSDLDLTTEMISVVNLKGDTYYSGKDTTIDIGNWPNGIYLVRYKGWVETFIKR